MSEIMDRLVSLYLYKFIAICIGIFALVFLFKVLYIRLTGKGSTGKNTNEKISRSVKSSGLILEKKKKIPGFIFGRKNGKQVILRNDEEGHMAIFGGTGTGKTSAVVIPTLRNWNAPFFSIDISGDITRNVDVPKESKIMLVPEDYKKGSLYNIFYKVDKEEDEHRKRNILENLVYLMIEIPEKVGDAQIYFLTTARKIFFASMLAFYDIGMGFTDICKTIYFNDLKSLIKLIEATENELAIGYIKPLYKENEKNVAGAKNQLNDKIKLFADDINMQMMIKRTSLIKKNVFSSRDIEDKKVFLKISDKMQEYYTPFIHIVTAQLLEYISGRMYDKNFDSRILIVLDEFASIGYLNVLPPFRKFRKNGANLCILTQSLIDIDLVYSQNERKAILDNCKYIVVLDAKDNGTREYFSNLVGKENMEQKSTSKSKHGSSINTSVQRKYIIEPEYWKNLKGNLVVIHSKGYLVLKKNFYYKDYTSLFNKARKFIKKKQYKIIGMNIWQGFKKSLKSRNKALFFNKSKD